MVEARPLSYRSAWSRLKKVLEMPEYQETLGAFLERERNDLARRQAHADTDRDMWKAAGMFLEVEGIFSWFEYVEHQAEKEKSEKEEKLKQEIGYE